MIKAVFHKDEEGKITSFKVEGHAGYAPSGSEEVCAAVSALVVGTINGLEALADATFNTAVSHGFTRVDIKETTVYSSVLLITSLISLKGIQEE